MAPNNSNVLSSDSKDDVSDGMADVNANVCRRTHVAAVLSSHAGSNGAKLKAPLHVDHLFWRCAVAGASSETELIPVFDALIDHGAHAVLICESVVEELKLKRKKLSRPEEVEGAMTNPGEVGMTTTLTEYVKIKLYCPVSGWVACSVRAIVTPSLCAPIKLGLPWIGFNKILVDVSLRSAVCKTDGIDILHPIPRVTKTIIGPVETECQLRRKARAVKAEDDQKSRILKLIWHGNDAPDVKGRENVFWNTASICLDDGSERRVRATVDGSCAANVINPDTVAHLHLSRQMLDEPVLHKYTSCGVEKVASITEYVNLKLSTPCFEYVTKNVVALVVPDCDMASEQIVLGSPFVKDNRLLLDDETGSLLCKASGRVLVAAPSEAVEPKCVKENVLPKLSRERVNPKSVIASVRERLEILTAQQELIDRGDKLKADFPRLFEELAAEET